MVESKDKVEQRSFLPAENDASERFANEVTDSITAQRTTAQTASDSSQSALVFTPLTELSGPLQHTGNPAGSDQNSDSRAHGNTEEQPRTPPGTQDQTLPTQPRPASRRQPPNQTVQTPPRSSERTGSSPLPQSVPQDQAVHTQQLPENNRHQPGFAPETVPGVACRDAAPLRPQSGFLSSLFDMPPPTSQPLNGDLRASSHNSARHDGKRDENSDSTTHSLPPNWSSVGTSGEPKITTYSQALPDIVTRPENTCPPAIPEGPRRSFNPFLEQPSLPSAGSSGSLGTNGTEGFVPLLQRGGTTSIGAAAQILSLASCGTNLPPQEGFRPNPLVGSGDTSAQPPHELLHSLATLNLQDVPACTRLPNPDKPTDGSGLQPLLAALNNLDMPLSMRSPNPDKPTDGSGLQPGQDFQRRGPSLLSNLPGEDVSLTPRNGRDPSVSPVDNGVPGNQTPSQLSGVYRQGGDTGSSGGGSGSTAPSREINEIRYALNASPGEQAPGSRAERVDSLTSIQNLSKKAFDEENLQIALRHYAGPGTRPEAQESSGNESALAFRRFLQSGELPKLSLTQDAADSLSSRAAGKGLCPDFLPSSASRAGGDLLKETSGEVSVRSDFLKGKFADVIRSISGGSPDGIVAVRFLDGKAILTSEGKILVGEDGKPLIGSDGKPLTGSDRRIDLAETAQSIRRQDHSGKNGEDAAQTPGHTILGMALGLPGDPGDSSSGKPTDADGEESEGEGDEDGQATADKRSGKQRTEENLEEEDNDAPINAALATAGKKSATKGNKDGSGKTTEQAQPERRVKHVVKEGETLESIARDRLGNSGFAPLILTINRGSIHFKDENGKQVPALRTGQILWLPTGTEMTIHRGTYFGSSKNRKYTFSSKILQEIEGPSAQPNFHPPALAIVDEQGAAPPVNSPEAAPADNQSSDGTENRRRLHRVRLGETLRSIALRDPLMSEAGFWPLLATLNDLPVYQDETGQTVPVPRRGSTLKLPTQSEVEAFRQSAIQDNPAGGIRIFSASCRLVSADRGDEPAFCVRLQLNVNNIWLTIAAYELKDGRAARYQWNRRGKLDVFPINLPPTVVRQMAAEDFARNWQSLAVGFLCQKHASG